MTLKDFIDWLGQNPTWLLCYFAALPLLAVVVGMITKKETYLSQWRYAFSGLIYLACIPGIFAVALSAYFFLFERRSILDMNLYVQVLPFLVMMLTLWIIRRYLPFEYIPGFQKISGLMLMIFCTLALMWFIDRTRIVVFSYLPFQYLLGIFAVILAAMAWGWKRFFS